MSFYLLELLPNEFWYRVRKEDSVPIWRRFQQPLADQRRRNRTKWLQYESLLTSFDIVKKNALFFERKCVKESDTISDQIVNGDPV
jgi:hypothetical protein